MTANIHAVNLGAGAIFSLSLSGLSIGEADFIKSLAETVTKDQVNLPQHSNHEVILDAAMRLCDQFAKDDPEYTSSAIRLAALCLRIAVEGNEAFDRVQPVIGERRRKASRNAVTCRHEFHAVPKTLLSRTGDFYGECVHCGYVPKSNDRGAA